MTSEFVRESNCIEGIRRDPLLIELKAHEELWGEREMTVKVVEKFVADICSRPLRDAPGLDVRVGNHLPPRGGPGIRDALAQLLYSVNAGEHTPYEIHVKYETLHPFMDGNGRSGRAIWAWQMRRDGFDPFALPFLHSFYYQALDAERP